MVWARKAEQALFVVLPLLVGVSCHSAVAADAAGERRTLEAVLAETPALGHEPLERTRPDSIVTVDCADLSYPQQVTMMFLQGLANRQGPRMFLEGLHEPNLAADRLWLLHLEEQYGIANRSLDWTEALAEFGPELDGIVVWDPEVPVTENIAGMVGSLLSWLPCAPEDRDTVDRASGLPIAFDLRGMWRDPIEAQRWALKHLAPKLSTEDIGCIVTRVRDVRLCRDWLVMRAAPMVDLSGSTPEEHALKDEFYSRMTPGGIVWGWVTSDGEPYVEHASRHGLRVICSTSSANLSLFSQLEPRRTSWTQPKSEPWGKTEEKAYLAFVLATGDTAPSMLNRQWGRWDEAARGTVPFGWEIQPLFARLAPVVLESYYDSASPLDRFVCGASGAGYAQTQLLPDPASFMADTAEVCGLCDLDIVGLHTEFRDDHATLWAEQFPGAKGFLYGWDGRPDQHPRLFRGQAHVYYGLMPPAPDGEKDGAYYEGVASKIREYAEGRGLPSVLFVHMYPVYSGPDDVPRIMAALGDFPAEVVPVDTAVEIERRIAAGVLGAGLE